MPELPEVELAARRVRAAAVGKTISAVTALHPAHRRRLPPAAARKLRGVSITAIDRRGKHQLLRLGDGATLHVHFRMTGDWDIGRCGDALPRHARVAIELSDGTRITLVDPRALSAVTVHPPGHDPLPRMGPDATDAALSAEAFGAALASRRVSIKLALLDQRVLAGIGNIYAAEALWLARIDPRAVASSLGPARRRRLLAAVRSVLRRAERDPAPYSDRAPPRFRVYDREGRPCPRCGTGIRRIGQGGRSTYYCPRCQAR